MPSRPLRQCAQPGCSVLLAAGDRCQAHAKPVTRDRFKQLDERKTPEQRDFYNRQLWKTTTKQHRINEPLCRKCREGGKVVPATLVHHDPDLSVLLSRGLNPYDDQYLVSLCLSCHQAELSAKAR